MRKFMLIKLRFRLNRKEICILISVEYNFKVPSHSDSILCVEIEQVFFERRRCYGLMTLNGQGSPVNRKE